MLVALLGCHENSEKAPEPPKIVEVRDDHSATLARIQAGLPCRATFAGSELLVDAKPSLESAGAKWSAEDRGRDVAILKDGQLFARVVRQAQEQRSGRIDVFDPKGIAMVRVSEAGGRVHVANAGGVPLREGQRGNPVTIGNTTVSGIDDAQLAALIAAPELAPEVRALVACTALRREGA